MEEEWRPFPGLEGMYEVSSLGRVRSLDRKIETKNGQARFYRGKVLSLKLSSNGYLCLNARGKDYRIHRVVAEAFHGAPPDPSMDTCHNDGNRLNNKASNLRWGTRSENHYDKGKHGTDWNKIKTHCHRGHKLEDPNLTPSIKKMDGEWRGCLACSRGISWCKYKSRVTDEALKSKICDIYYESLMSGEDPLPRVRSIFITEG